MALPPGRRLPTLAEISADPSLLYGLSPQEQDLLLRALKGVPTPVTSQSQSALITPWQFATERLGMRPTPAALRHGYTSPFTPGQLEVCKSVVQNRNTAVVAGRGVGKTSVAAVVAIWYLYTFGPRCIVVTTAPTFRQVKKLLWAEIRGAFYRAHPPLIGECLTTEIKTGHPLWYAIGLSTRSETGDMVATDFSGFHAPYVLMVIDEATGVDPEVWKGSDGICLGPNDRVLALGNPTDPTSEYRQRCLLPTYNVIRLDCRAHPNVIHNDPLIIPGAVTRDWVEEREEEYEGVDNPLFKALVSGEWPDDRSDAVIPITVLRDAQDKWEDRVADLASGEVKGDGKGRAIGADIAREGSDLVVISDCENGLLQPLKWLAKKATTETAGWLIREYNERGGRIICIDDTGVGGGVTDQLRQAQREGVLPKEPDLRVVGVNFSANAYREDRYNRIKDQMWWELREDMKSGKVVVPPDTAIAALRFPRHSSMSAQLMKSIYVLDNRSRIDVLDRREPHDERTLTLSTRSPDIAHSMLLARLGWSLLRPMQDNREAKTPLEATSLEFGNWIRDKVGKHMKEHGQTVKEQDRADRGEGNEWGPE